MKNTKGILCIVAIGLLLVVQLLHPARAFADGEGTPEVTETSQPTEPVVETTSPTNVPDVTSTPDPNEPTGEPVVATSIATQFDTPGADEPTVEPVVTTPALTEFPTEEEDETKVALMDTSTPTAEPVVSEDDIIVEEPSLGEVLSEIPAETEVIVLDESGQPEPLVTVEAAEAISSGDPIWCPNGVAPTPGVNGCTTSYATVGALVANEGVGINANGTIWITSGIVSDSNPVIIDGSVYSNWANYSLTLQGGWSGLSGDTTIASNSTFNNSISIATWAGNVNINDLSIIGVNGTGLYVQTDGAILGTDINASNNTGTGAILDGATSVTLEGTNTFNGNGTCGLDAQSPNGYMTLNNITANENKGDKDINKSVSLYAKGTITINTITANENNGWGALIASQNDVIFNGPSTFNSNGNTGVDVFVNGYSGDIVVNGNMAASDNGTFGASLQGSESVILNGSNNIFNGNRYDGLEIGSEHFPIYITLQNITANNNQVDGANLFAFLDITLDGINSFNSNGQYGLDVATMGGDIIINDVTANNNYDSGLLIRSVLLDPANDITLSNVVASGNKNYGVQVANAGDIHLMGGTFTENGTGIDVAFVDNVTFNNVTAYNNVSTGMSISDADNITLNDVTANDSKSTGISVSNAGDIALNNVTANNNTSTGMSINNANNISLTGGTITGNEVGLYVSCVKNVTFQVPQTIIIGNAQDIVIDPSCSVSIATPIPPVIQSQGIFDLDCSRQTEYPVPLPNGDLVNIFCPVSGTAEIYRLDNTNLPENLPEGYTYASAFTLDILQEGQAIPVIREGGRVKSSFVAQPLQPGNTYTVLYWDPWTNEDGKLIKNPSAGRWVPLNDFLFDENGNAESFPLYPGTDDPRQIYTGVNLVHRNGPDSIEVSTNFPGIFVLAQR